MRIDPQILTLDIKVQDKFRERLADLANGNIKSTCVMLGDSDIDYENSLDMDSTRILNAPFNVEGIKYPLVYDGAGRGLEGYVTCFIRKVSADGRILSMYEYPANDTFIIGQTVPSVQQGNDMTSLTFNEDKMGYIIFFQTVLINYVDQASSMLKRLTEKIKMTVTFDGSEVVPTGWAVVKDEGSRIVQYNNSSYIVHNNSMLLGKIAGSPLTVNANGVISAIGALSNIKKNITFNI